MSVAMHRKYLLIMAVAISLRTISAVQASDMHTDSLRPIIAQLVRAPEEFEGRRIQIYGLVVDSNLSKKTFMLQDVSQRPLLIEGASLPAIRTGDQVEVSGFVRRAGRDIVFAARKIKHVQVIAGGGCC